MPRPDLNRNVDTRTEDGPQSVSQRRAVGTDHEEFALVAVVPKRYRALELAFRARVHRHRLQYISCSTSIHSTKSEDDKLNPI